MFLFVWSLPKETAQGCDLGLPNSQQWQRVGMQRQKISVNLPPEKATWEPESQITRITGAAIRWGWKSFGAKLLEELLSDLMCQLQRGLRSSSGCDLSSKGWGLEFSKHWGGAVKRVLRWGCGCEGRIESMVCSDPNPTLPPLPGSPQYYFILPMFSFSLFRWGWFLSLKTSLDVTNPQIVSRTL